MVRSWASKSESSCSACALPALVMRRLKKPVGSPTCGFGAIRPLSINESADSRQRPIGIIGSPLAAIRSMVSSSWVKLAIDGDLLNFVPNNTAALISDNVHADGVQLGLPLINLHIQSFQAGIRTAVRIVAENVIKQLLLASPAVEDQMADSLEKISVMPVCMRMRAGISKTSHTITDRNGAIFSINLEPIMPDHHSNAFPVRIWASTAAQAIWKRCQVHSECFCPCWRAPASNLYRAGTEYPVISDNWSSVSLRLRRQALADSWGFIPISAPESYLPSYEKGYDYHCQHKCWACDPDPSAALAH